MKQIPMFTRLCGIRSRSMFCRGMYLHLTPWQTVHLGKLPAALIRVCAGKTYNTYRCFDPIHLPKKTD